MARIIIPKKTNAYTQIIESIFFKHYHDGDTIVPFERTDIIKTANKLKIKLPKNLGDVLYSFRFRTNLPESIKLRAPKGKEWIIRLTGRARYSFVITEFSNIIPSTFLTETKIPNSTPGIIESYALTDEQALLAKIRYNRLVDIFTGITCYSLQSHLRTYLPNVGQVETDEIYVGLDKRGIHYVLPIQAKGSRDKLGIVQIEQDVALCEMKFPNLVPKPIGTQFIEEDLIAMFELEMSEKGITVVSEKHYRLVDPSELSPEDLQNYRNRVD